MHLFYELMKPDAQTKVLDVGAQIAPDDEADGQLINSYSWKANISTVNILDQHTRAILDRFPEVDARTADARSLPWPDKHFDIVYSNAVIEHVGDLQAQRQMASEIMRVGRRWFVTTPNRWYPFEFHLRLPLVTWLPGQAYLTCGRIYSYNHVRGKYVSGLDCSGLRLMTARELRGCFPESRIIPLRVTFMAETLIVVGGDGS
jgi:SAM-dependent methyltransferase